MSVLVETVGRVGVISIDRPHVRNAVDRPTAQALTSALRAIEADDELDVAVLTGTGGTFCSGADLGAVAGTTVQDAERRNDLHQDGDAPMGPSRLRLTKPVIAAIAGHAVAGGLELALWCDLRVVEADAVLGVFCRRWGVPLIDGGTARLPHIVGLGRALDLTLTGRPVGAAEALAIGLADRVVAVGAARDAAVALAQQLSALPQACLRSDRTALLDGLGVPVTQAMSREFSLGVGVLGDGIDGAGRFVAGAGRGGAAG